MFVLLYESAFKARKGNIVMINEEKLIKRLKEHNTRAYEQLIDGYSRLLFTVCAGILHGVGTREDVEDVVADCFCEFWQNVQKYDPDRAGLKTYLCAIARSRAVDRLRLLCRRREDSFVSVFDDTAQTVTDDMPLEYLISKESVLAVWKYMKAVKAGNVYFGINEDQYNMAFTAMGKELYLEKLANAILNHGDVE